MKRTRDSVNGHTLFVRQELKRFTRHVRNFGPDLTIILGWNLFSSDGHAVLWSLLETLSISCIWTSSLNHTLSRPCLCSGWWMSSICWFVICSKFWSKSTSFKCFPLKKVSMSTWVFSVAVKLSPLLHFRGAIIVPLSLEKTFLKFFRNSFPWWAMLKSCSFFSVQLVAAVLISFLNFLRASFRAARFPGSKVRLNHFRSCLKRTSS